MLEMTTKMLALAVAVIAAASLVLAPAASSAEEDSRPCPVDYCFPVTDLYGHVPRPTAVYVLHRDRLSFERSQADESFTSEIIESVRLSPF
jgi:hypothetical protein